ncbi:hypothetical protein O0L34_g3166 [Tuta absoluta]|nr:hypothetical protein O0L34_g3166 [Tuta absoluta]
MVFPMRGVSQASLTSIANLVNMAFGPEDANIVDFRMLYALLLLMARSLDVLQRQVFVKCQKYRDGSLSTMSITEVKISGKGMKKISKSQEDPNQTSPENLSEKLLIVELTPSREGFISPTSGVRHPMSIATKADYNRLLAQVMELKKRFGSIDVPGFELSESMYQRTVLSDPLSILQLSARLEYTERNINEIYSVLLGLAGQPPQQILQGVSALPAYGGEPYGRQGTRSEAYVAQEAPIADHGVEGAQEGAYGRQRLTIQSVLIMQGATYHPKRAKGSASYSPDGVHSVQAGLGGAYGSQGTLSSAYGAQAGQWGTYGPKSVAQELQEGVLGIHSQPDISLDVESEGLLAIDYDTMQTPEPDDFVDPQFLRFCLQKAKNDLPKVCIVPTRRAVTSANQAIAAATKLASQISFVTDMEAKVNATEDAITQFGIKVSAVDTEYAQQITAYHEEIGAMQQDLEEAIDTMAERLTTRVPDTELIDDLDRKFNALRIDLQATFDVQLELDGLLEDLENKLVAMAEEVKLLQDKKASRMEVEEALATKVDVRELNGKMTKVHFNAVCGEFEKIISSAYDKFNNQESYWQKCIDDLDLECRQKPHKMQVGSLKLDINDKIEILRNRFDAMIEIASRYSNEFKPEARKVKMNKKCISCGTEILRPTEKQSIKKVPIEVEDTTEEIVTTRERPSVKKIAKSDDCRDRKPCYPTAKVDHPVAEKTKDMRKCMRICGERFWRPDFPFDIKRLKRDTPFTLSQPKTFQKPCIPCNPPPPRRRPPRRSRDMALAETAVLQKVESKIMEEGMGEEEQPEDIGSAGSLEKFLKYSMYFGPELFEEIHGVGVEVLGEGDGKGLKSSEGIQTQSVLQQGTVKEIPSERRVIGIESKPLELKTEPSEPKGKELLEKQSDVSRYLNI